MPPYSILGAATPFKSKPNKRRLAQRSRLHFVVAVSVAEGKSSEVLRGQESVGPAGFTGVRALHTLVGSRYFKVQPRTRGDRRCIVLPFRPKNWLGFTDSVQR